MNTAVETIEVAKEAVTAGSVINHLKKQSPGIFTWRWSSPPFGCVRCRNHQSVRSVLLMAYNYGKSFKKDGKMVRYRYTDKDPKSKKLVAVASKKKNTRRKAKK